MEVDVKGLFTMGYFGMLLLCLVSGGLFLLILAVGIYQLESGLVLIFSSCGLLMIMVMTSVFTNRLRHIFYTNEFERERKRKYDQTIHKFDDLDFEQDNV
jgi:multisubunit Na+/H+ antiporter MnhG subunit